MKKIVTMTALCLSLSACASMFNGGLQNVKIDTTGADKADCSLENGQGTYSVSSTPASVAVERSTTRLNVNCTAVKGGKTYTGKTSARAGVNPFTFLNLLFGGVIGLGIDAATGDLGEYDEVVTVPMQSSN